jgi:hypothetical protein
MEKGKTRPQIFTNNKLAQRSKLQLRRIQGLVLPTCYMLRAGPTSRSLQIFFFVLCGLGSNCGRLRTKLSAASASLRICASTRTGVSCRGDPGQQGLGPLPGLGVGPGMGPWLLKSPPDNNRAPCNIMHTVQTLPSQAKDTVSPYSPVQVGRRVLACLGCFS